MSFHRLGISEGLHDGTVRCIGQDKYGYIWIGSAGALNRYDGKNVVHYTKVPGDTLSPYGSQPRCIHSDKKGRLWLGFETGLMEFDFEKKNFKKIYGIKDVFVNKIISLNDSILFLATRRGLIKYNTLTGDTLYYSNSTNPKHRTFIDIALYDMVYKNGTLYLASSKGLVLFNPAADEARSVNIEPIGVQPIYSIAIDAKDNVWIGTHQQVKLMKLSSDLKLPEIYDRFLTSEINTQPQNVMGILIDNQDRKWVVTAIDGLLEYIEDENRFIKHLHNPNIPSSPSGNNYRTIFQDNKGIVWLGCDYKGVNYFEPDKLLFKTILPFPDQLDERARRVARAITEDKYGNLWMGNHDGVTRFNPATNQYTVWRNERGKKPILYNNVVRSILCDNENNIWIGTATGVNRLNGQTGKMEFIDAKNLPLAFYNSINQDKSGNIWFSGNTGAGLNWYDPKQKKYFSMYDHPLLKPYAGITPGSYVMEDSKNRLWISYSRRGVLMVDNKKGIVKQYLANDTLGRGIIGNQVVDIKEDKDGVIWITSLNGITGINPEKDTFLSFNNKNGLPGNWCAALAVDLYNRLWIGVNGALTMISADRKNMTLFSMADGLPSIGFPEHAGITTNNGDIIFPTYNGYIRFRPDDYKEVKNDVSYYINSYALFDKLFPISPKSASRQLSLGAYENSFSFNLVALNYINPHQTWFAYKLEGFENNWHLTQDPRAVYTNVPGGNYTFLYKAMVGNSQWESIEGKKLSVHIKTLFYKSVWFWALVVLLLAGGLFMFLKHRTQQQRQMYQLKSKAQLLEKEKAMVMYGSLKQQLNPHFLFNSLTSLAGLIEADQQLAGKFLQRMSDMYRYILKNGEHETVSLLDEIKFAKLYVEIQQTRFGNGLMITINVPEDCMNYRIAPVTLQNMIENAIKHNIVDEGSPLVVKIYTENDYILVSNNLQKKNMVETSNKTGLDQFRSLYRFLSEKPVVIEENGIAFVVKIPLL